MADHNADRLNRAPSAEPGESFSRWHHSIDTAIEFVCSAVVP